MVKTTKKIDIGGVAVGGGASVKIQSMCTTKTSDVAATVGQILTLQSAGCEIIRVSVLDEDDAKAIKEIKNKIKIPLVADIHFSGKLAVSAIENGCDKVRINPGNIGSESAVKTVADCIRAHKIAVRVGSNTGSIEKEFLQKYGRNEFALVESALKSVALLEKYGVNENDRKRMLGHSFGADITNAIYGHRTVDDLRREIEKIKLPEICC